MGNHWCHTRGSGSGCQCGTGCGPPRKVVGLGGFGGGLAVSTCHAAMACEQPQLEDEACLLNYMHVHIHLPHPLTVLLC